MAITGESAQVRAAKFQIIGYTRDDSTLRVTYFFLLLSWNGSVVGKERHLAKRFVVCHTRIAILDYTDSNVEFALLMKQD
jgi:hypothetical protein